MINQRKTIISLIIVICILSLVIIACTGTYESSSQKWNIASVYNPSKSKIHPSFKVFHNSTNTSILFVRFYTNELLFQPIGPNGEMISEVSVKYTLMERNHNNQIIADTGTYNTTFLKKTAGNSTLSQIPIKAEKGKSYHLKVIARDKLRKSFYLSFIDIEKGNEYGHQFYNVTHIDGSPIFKNIIIGDAPVRVLHSAPSTDKLYISYYKNETPVPKPTYAVSGEDVLYQKRDSLYIVDYTPASAIQLIHNGLYFLQLDTNINMGVSITKFDENFPKVKTKEDLIGPLAYITTSAEHKKLLLSENKKLAADEFWIKAAGSTDRGRELIRIYYNRVYFANYYFTTTTPGWKTDRGMVYIVYGPPHNMKKTDKYETWYYYHPGSSESISFTFDYSPSKYFINQYRLRRFEGHTWHWKEAVYAWKNGEIFLQD